MEQAKQPADLSSHRHRVFIGVAGAALPPLAWYIARRLPTTGLDASALKSVSAYFYSSAIVVFVGTLIALSVFMFTYRGYEDKKLNGLPDPLDRRAALVAGATAALVAFFPTAAPDGLQALLWWTPPLGVIHYVAAALLFAAFAFYCLVLFPRTHSTAPADRWKPWRNKVYYVCGAAILGCMVWAFVRNRANLSIFWPETLALEVFAFSWLIKGRLDRNILHPVDSARGLRSLLRGE